MIPLKEKQKWQEWLLANPTNAEAKIHAYLSTHPTLANKYECQAIINGFILDFWFPSAKLAVEIDGSIHQLKEQISKDRHKNTILKAHGIYVLRISNKTVYENIKKAVFRISNAFNQAHKRNYISTIQNKAERNKAKHRFLTDHASKYNGGSGSIRRKSNPAGASNPKPNLMLTQRPKGWR
jgi:very-short-patch-repair endonuclease